VDHIKPESAGGATSLANLALCCYGCQQRKFVFELGLDPLSNKPTPLYNPRRQRWFRHFQWSPDYLVLEGLTSVGRATIERLALNNWRQVQARMRWRMHPDIFP
jgi:hypothetical protein